ncbi:S1C family serine protease [Polymorphospora rubra]|uniref:Peptidase S1 and S6 chymotrypsin/Hap n=1 Tax=Polymorphospora rubra TaxID=338584 RepID=A0A810N3Q4_9ACTN|nr:trypsin-like peptidase domain-containing protein [Polymorphospora rubra]BCJ67204.1 hypothetical protein Prubr_42250 [Polymorphospora rubra]
MTAGYDPYAGQPGNQQPAPGQPAADGSETRQPPAPETGTPARPGPLPPKMEPPQLAPPPPPPAQPWSGAGSPVTQSWPTPGSPVVAAPQPRSAPPVHPPAGFPGAAPPPAARRRVSWPGVVALVLALFLGVVAGLQAVQINDLSERLAAADDRLADAQASDGSRFEGLEGRTGELEKQAGDVFNPEAISTVALPSVFRVSAGNSGGTAFAVGKPAEGGGTNLFTNFHVVESVWNSGGREVFIERRDQRFPAMIVRVDERNDVAQLVTTGAFTGLVTATEPVKSGQQVVVVGAPLGLEDTVTTGVVSAFRTMPGGGPSMIQFDASINPGNSGGPVINSAKQVVGIATAKVADAEGVGLAIPIATACDGFQIC